MALGWLGGALGSGMALGDIDFHFAWQAWHLATLTFTLRFRRRTWRHGPSLCVAGAWQAWHLCHWAGSGGALGSGGRRGCLRGRCGTW